MEISEVHFIDKELITLGEFAVYFDISERSARRFIKNSKIITIKEPGLGLRIVKSSLDDYFKNRIQEREEKIKQDADFVQSIKNRALAKYSPN